MYGARGKGWEWKGGFLRSRRDGVGDACGLRFVLPDMMFRFRYCDLLGQPPGKKVVAKGTYYKFGFMGGFVCCSFRMFVCIS